MIVERIQTKSFYKYEIGIYFQTEKLRLRMPNEIMPFAEPIFLLLNFIFIILFYY